MERKADYVLRKAKEKEERDAGYVEEIICKETAQKGSQKVKETGAGTAEVKSI